MDVITNSQLIDIGLNLIGFLTAGALWHLLFRSRSQRPVAVAAAPAPLARPESTSSTGLQQLSRSGGEFLDLSRTASPCTASPEVASTGTGGAQRRRNRTEVMRLATALLQQGVSGEQIRRDMPITEGELALLRTRQAAQR